MHLLEIYALSTGSKIKKPFILKKYFPIPFEKYITIQNSSGMPGKCYDYFQNVVDFLLPLLEKENYKIVQIGSKDDKPLNNVINLQGQTNIHQTAFIIDNAKLHIGNDSFAIHVASAFNIPLVALYSVSSPEIAGPFWKNDNQICLTPENWKPSFNPNDSPKRINEIKIEQIINTILKLIWNDKTLNLETVFTGQRFYQRVLECTGEQMLDPNLFKHELLNIRLDYTDTIGNQEYISILNNLNSRPCSVVTNKPFNLEPLMQFKNNLQAVFYDITDNIDLDFIKTLNSYGLKYVLLFKQDNNESILNNRKLDIIDYQDNIQIINNPKLNIDIASNTFYKSNKFLFSRNKLYLSRAAHLEDLNSSDLNNPIQSLSEIKNKQIFLEEDASNSFIFNTK